jgi:magnesium transporter
MSDMNSNGKKQDFGENDFFFLSQIVDSKIFTVDAIKYGKLMDVEVTLDTAFPSVTNLIVKHSFGVLPEVVPWRNVTVFKPGRIIIKMDKDKKFQEYKSSEERLLLEDVVLDKKVLDIKERELEVVYDIHLLYANNNIYMVHVDISRRGLLRRLHLEFIYKLFYGGELKSGLLSWRHVNTLHQLSKFKGQVKVDLSKDQIKDLHPVDLADILEELQSHERLNIFGSLDAETAADTLDEVEPRVQRQLIQSMGTDVFRNVLKRMTPSEIADLFSELAFSDVEQLSSFVDEGTLKKVKRLLGQHEQTAFDLSLSNFLEMPQDMSCKEAFLQLREKTRDVEAIHYVYVTDSERNLKGVVDLRELLRADPDILLRDIMTQTIISVLPEANEKEIIDLFQRYQFQTIPVVNPEGKILGVVRSKDVLFAEE